MFKHKGSILALSCAISLAYGVNLVSADKQEVVVARKEREIKVSDAAKIVGISSLTLGGPAGVYVLGEMIKKRFSKESQQNNNNLENGEYINPEGNKNNKSKKSENSGKNKKNDNKKSISVLEIIFIVVLLAYVSTIIFKLVRRSPLEKIEKEIKERNPGEYHYVEYESFLNPFNYNWVCYYDELEGKDMFNENELDECKIKEGELKDLDGEHWGWDQKKYEINGDGLIEKEGKFQEQELMIFGED